ncbi:MAG: tetratricopeptide repeat protein [Candidatus Shapirobacteria bacterium]|nr:tetratricopeptide repeat protein [Candidatus Shapirobacteria bacterium]MDD4410525.1 tetratricopeptide repeat protein [Candidatus Shapirobacteria bacterium]
MSQKKLKKLRKLEAVNLVKEVILEPVAGFRQIIKENWKFLLALIVGVFILYLNSLHGDFVSDDYASITQYADIKNLSVVLKKPNLPGFTNSVLAIIFGITSSFPYHLTNLILYLLILIVAFVFVFLITRNKITSMLTLVLYAVLPVHAETISWISGRPYLFVALFVLLSLDLLILFLNKKQPKYLWLMLPTLILLFLTDRIRGFAIVILSVLYFLTYKNELGYKFKIGKILIAAIVVTVTLAIISWPMIQARIGDVNSGYNGSESVFYNPFFQYPTSIAKYLQIMLFPVDMTLYHTMYILPVWLNWMILLTFLASIGYFFFKDKKMFFALAFIFLAAAPSMAPVKVSWLVAERYVLLGSLGLCLFLILFFQRFDKKWKIPFLILFVIFTGLYSARVYLRNIDWKTNHNLWVSTCQYSPNSHNAWNNIGDDYDKLAQLETTPEGQMNQYLNSIKGFTRSTIVKTNYADAFHNRANIFYKIGRYDLARDSYETALYYGPNLYQSYFSLLQIDLSEKRYDLAMDHLNKLHKAKPNDIQVYYVTAVVYANAGMKDEAKKLLTQILQAYPEFQQAKDLLDQLNKM